MAMVKRVRVNSTAQIEQHTSVLLRNWSKSEYPRTWHRHFLNGLEALHLKFSNKCLLLYNIFSW